MYVGRLPAVAGVAAVKRHGGRRGPTLCGPTTMACGAIRRRSRATGGAPATWTQIAPLGRPRTLVECLASLGMTLLVSREYEHLVIGLSASGEGPRLTYLPMPHPSGIAVDRDRGRVHVASTRNPNEIYELAPVAGLLARTDVDIEPLADRPLIPIRTRFLPEASTSTTWR